MTIELTDPLAADPHMVTLENLERLRRKFNAGISDADVASMNASKLTSTTTAYTPALTASTTNPSLGAGTAEGRYLRVGNWLFGTIAVQFGAGMSAGSGQYFISTPVTARSATVVSGSGRIVDAGTDNILGELYLDTTGRWAIVYEGGNVVTDSLPVVWASGDAFFFTFMLEAA